MVPSPPMAMANSAPCTASANGAYCTNALSKNSARSSGSAIGVIPQRCSTSQTSLAQESAVSFFKFGKTNSFHVPVPPIFWSAASACATMACGENGIGDT